MVDVFTGYYIIHWPHVEYLDLWGALPYDIDAALETKHKIWYRVDAILDTLAPGVQPKDGPWSMSYAVPKERNYYQAW